MPGPYLPLLAVLMLLAAACGDAGQTTTAPAATTDSAPESSDDTPSEAPATEAEESLSTATSATEPDESPSPFSTADFPVVIEHQFGSTEIDEQPERVVSVGFTDQDYLLALGVTPVGVREWFGEHPHATWPWASDELGDAEPLVLARDEVDLEQVAALDPDLIIGLYSGMTEEEYGLLAEIAPTVAPSAEFRTFAIPWQEQTRITGRALGLEQRAEQLVAEVEEQFATVRDAHPEFDGATAVLAAAPAADEYYIYGSDTASGQLLLGLGFELPPEVQELTDNDDSIFAFSAERLDLVDADLLAWFEAAEDPGPADLLADPLYQGLDVFTEGRDLYLGYDLYGGALAFNSILSLPFVLDELVPQLAIALDGDPATKAELGS